MKILQWAGLTLMGILTITLAASWSWSAGESGRGVLRVKDQSGKEIGSFEESHALVIGVSNYQAGWSKLPGVKKDVMAVKETLNKLGFLVEIVNDPDHDQLRQVFRTFISKYGQRENVRLLFYFAGHGHTEKMSYGEDMGYIVPVNAPLPSRDKEGFQAKALPMQLVEVYAKEIQSRHALFVFDSCFSGSIFAMGRAPNENISAKTALPVRQFITSGTEDEVVPDRSVFREQFLAALTGEGDTNRDGYVTGVELGEFLQDKVVNYSKGSQHPQYGKIRNPRLDKGDFVFQIGRDGGPKQAQVGPVAGADRETVFWQSIQGSKNTGDYNAYLQQFPSGVFAPLARNRLVELQPVQVADLTVGRTTRREEPAQTSTTGNRESLSGMEFVRVPGGTFKMGCGSWQSDCDGDEQPVHSVTVGGFEMGKYEVTQGQWQAVMGNNPSRFSSCGDNCPVERVSWEDVQGFVKKLNGRRDGYTYRLPTEAEWEYACRSGGKEEKYCGGNNVDQVAWYRENSDNKTHPVGQKDKNGLGLYDMSGNVYEWASDWYDGKYYANSPQNNPIGPSTGSDRVDRGGSCSYYPAGVRSADRNSVGPGHRFDDLGFRLIRTYP